VTQRQIVRPTTANSISVYLNIYGFLVRLCYIAALLLISACSDIQGVSLKDGPGQPIDINSIGDAVPKVEPITKAGNKSPYTQFGKTYYVMRSSKGYRETGIASWYGSKFHGRKTSNGEVYNMYAMTAAHKTLPIPTYVRVTNQENRRSIVVRVNDRGPFHESRLIDLSYGAALKLGFAKKGTAKVSIEAIDPSTGSVWRQDSPVIKTKNTYSAINGLYLQAAAYENHQSAKTLANRIMQTLSLPVIIKKTDKTFKVWVGPFKSDNELLTSKGHLQKHLKLTAFTVKYNAPAD
jgi:rare lipoprotein A